MSNLKDICFSFHFMPFKWKLTHYGFCEAGDFYYSVEFGPFTISVGN